MINFGEGIVLHALEASDTYRMWRNDPQIWQWTRQNDLISKEAHGRWFESQGRDPSIKMYSIWLGGQYGEQDSVIGVCGLTSVNWQNRNAEFSLYLAPQFHGQKLSKPALKTLLYHGFQNLGLKSIWGETFQNNRAQVVFRALGMREDGIRRQFYWKDGQYWDAILFSILDEEFFGQHGRKSCFGT